MSDEDTPIPVDKAVSVLLPYGGMTADTLLRAIRKGRLKAERLGRRYYITKRAFDAWRGTCQTALKDLDSDSAREKVGPPSMSSATETKRLAQDAALAICEALTKGLPVTQPRRSGQTENNVISLKYQSGT